MNNERQAIVGLVAVGRITASEAERLLRAWNDGREGIWIVLACVLICLAQSHIRIPADAVGHWLQWAVAEWAKGMQMAGNVLLKGMGGRL